MVNTPHIPLVNRSFSADAWIYPTSITNPLHSSICGLCAQPANDFCMHMTLRLTGSIYPLYFGFYGDDLNSNAPAIVVKNWAHAAFTFNSPTRTMSIYLNGVLLGSSTTTNQLKAANGSFQIGNIPLLVTNNAAFQVLSC